MNIGDQIREARNQKHLSQDELAELIHVSRGKVSHWETGLRQPKAADIRELENVLQCKFEIEQEQPQSPEDQAAESPVQDESSDAAEKKIAFPAIFHKSVPAWLCAAIAGGIFAVMLVIMLCTTSNLQKQIDAMNRQPATPYSLAWYQQADEQQAGKAYVTITVDQDPVKGVHDPGGSDTNLWLYTVSMTEHHGIDFTVTEVSFQDFNGNITKGSEGANAEQITAAWGENIIPAYGTQYWGAGMPVQNVSHQGVLIRGVDARGNELEFRGVVNFSQEIAE